MTVDISANTAKTLPNKGSNRGGKHRCKRQQVSTPVEVSATSEMFLSTVYNITEIKILRTRVKEEKSSVALEERLATSSELGHVHIYRINCSSKVVFVPF